MITNKDDINNNHMKISDKLKQLFIKYYPDLDIQTIQPSLLSIMLENIIDNEKIIKKNCDKHKDNKINHNVYNKNNHEDKEENEENEENEEKEENEKDEEDDEEDDDEEDDEEDNKSIKSDCSSEIIFYEYKEDNLSLLEKNYLKATELIPEMLVSSKLIILQGKINGTNVRILYDTGASYCIMYKYLSDKLKLHSIINRTINKRIKRIDHDISTFGFISYIEIEIKTENDKYICCPISFNIIDDSYEYQTEDDNQCYQEELLYEGILEITQELEEKYNKIYEKRKKQRSFDIILGLNFMQAYKSKIDFSKNLIVLNDEYNIKFNC